MRFEPHSGPNTVHLERWRDSCRPYCETVQDRFTRSSVPDMLVVARFPKTTPITTSVSSGYVFFTERQESNAIAARLERELKSLESFGVQIDDFVEVRQYIQDYPDILGLLTPIFSRLNQAFPEPHAVSIELYVDPEQEDRYLRMLVRMNEYKEGVMDRISSAVTDFEEIVAGLDGYLLVTTDFEPPKG